MKLVGGRNNDLFIGCPGYQFNNNKCYGTSNKNKATIFDLIPQGSKDSLIFLISAPVNSGGARGYLRGANGYLTLEYLKNGFSYSDIWINGYGQVTNKDKYSILWSGEMS